MAQGITLHYLLVYSHTDQELLSREEFVDMRKAMSAYAAAEAEYRDRSDQFEVVLLGADSLDTITKTHGHYFRQASDSLFSEFLEENLVP